MMITCGSVGLFMAIVNLLIIEAGKHAYDSVAIGQSAALVGFVLMLVVAGFESRSETGTVFTTSTFDSRTMNLVAGVEAFGAVLITQWDLLNRLLGTTPLTARQWGLGLAAALALLLAWEAAKWIVRRSAGEADADAAVPATPDDVPIAA
jgi:Ca2+-transporting ATPase